MPRWTTLISMQNATKKMQSSCVDASHTAYVALLSLFCTPARWWLQISMQRAKADTFRENVSLISFPVRAEFV